MKIEVGKKYELNNGEIHKCTEMYGDDPLRVDKWGYGPFVINNMLYHQDGSFANRELEQEFRGVKREVSDEPTFDPLDPPAFGELTDAQKVDIMLHEASDGVVEKWFCNEWVESKPKWQSSSRYRKKPEPKRETVLIDVAVDDDGEWLAKSRMMPTHHITFDTIDGKPVCDSIKMEEL